MEGAAYEQKDDSRIWACRIGQCTDLRQRNAGWVEGIGEPKIVRESRAYYIALFLGACEAMEGGKVRMRED